ncbi:MAG TPA: hypothetical protein ENN40_08000 [Candidatus Aminicenantes bacterium]|nr:hypothetical protein [Candidatus Aminicenantes bacterium]
MKPCQNKHNQGGSILLLTVMAVMILSILVVGLLTVGTTEVQTTHNHYLNKVAYYSAIEGVEEVRNEIYKQPQPEYVTAINRDLYSTSSEQGPLREGYVTGTLRDLLAGTPQPVGMFSGFQPPPFPGLSLGSITSISPVIWNVTISSEIRAGGRRAYSELQTGIYSILTTGY